jgi:hypothetical protein
MRLRRWIYWCAALALASSSALAFQEQPAGGGVVPDKGQAAQSLDNSTAAPAPKSEGTEVTIPGLGKLGVLPKMDFGLELLYGADEMPKAQEPAGPTEPAAEPEDLTIRGSLKKTF